MLDDRDKGELNKTVNKTPAVLIPAINDKRKVTGVQRIYLDRAKPVKNSFFKIPNFPEA